MRQGTMFSREPSRRLSVEALKPFFLHGYRLEYKLPDRLLVPSLLPENAVAVRADERRVLRVSDGVPTAQME